jgi:3-deoxy-7-phosphoheptulonate synthase
MIIVIKPDASEEAIEQLKNSIQDQGLIVQDIKGGNARMLGLAGDVSNVSPDTFSRSDIVESAFKVREPYKLAGRRFHPEDTVVSEGTAKIGGGHFAEKKTVREQLFRRAAVVLPGLIQAVFRPEIRHSAFR